MRWRPSHGQAEDEGVPAAGAMREPTEAEKAAEQGLTKKASSKKTATFADEALAA